MRMDLTVGHVAHDYWSPHCSEDLTLLINQVTASILSHVEAVKLMGPPHELSDTCHYAVISTSVALPLNDGSVDNNRKRASLKANIVFRNFHNIV